MSLPPGPIDLDGLVTKGRRPALPISSDADSLDLIAELPDLEQLDER
jgi:hypothetical protein